MTYAIAFDQGHLKVIERLSIKHRDEKETIQNFKHAGRTMQKHNWTKIHGGSNKIINDLGW